MNAIEQSKNIDWNLLNKVLGKGRYGRMDMLSGDYAVYAPNVVVLYEYNTYYGSMIRQAIVNGIFKDCSDGNIENFVFNGIGLTDQIPEKNYFSRTEIEKIIAEFKGIEYNYLKVHNLFSYEIESSSFDSDKNALRIYGERNELPYSLSDISLQLIKISNTDKSKERCLLTNDNQFICVTDNEGYAYWYRYMPLNEVNKTISQLGSYPIDYIFMFDNGKINPKSVERLNSILMIGSSNRSFPHIGSDLKYYLKK